MTDDSTPWGTGLTVAAFVAVVLGAAIVVLGVGLLRVHPLLAVGLNMVAVGGLAPTVGLAAPAGVALVRPGFGRGGGVWLAGAAGDRVDPGLNPA